MTLPYLPRVRRQPPRWLSLSKPPRRVAHLALLPFLALALLLTGCASDDEPRKAGSDAGSASPSPSGEASSASPAPASPRVGSCYRLSFEQATEPVSTDRPVSCRKTHTARTIKVGSLPAVVDGHLLALDSRTVRSRIAKSCPSDAGALLGGDRTTRRLSRFEVVWFSPTLEAADAGASWFRCDVVAVRSEGRLLALPARLDGVLDRADALDRYGTCGTNAPDRRGFARVVCSVKHSWRAVDVVDLPAGARYLAKDVTARGDAACKDVASDRAGGALRFSWSFEWPTRAQWDAGQRYGYCWVPES